jgi:Fe-S-cluster-containing dehydrogenase component
VIFRAGEVADDLFLVRRGFVKVARDDGAGEGGSGGGGEVVMNYLSRGQYFGEIALLGAASGRQTTRTATCSAIDHADLIAVGREDVEDLLDDYPDFRAQLRAMGESRRAAAQPPPIRPGFNFRAYLDQELMQGTSLLLFDLDRCTRCDECVRACADSHGGVTRLKRDGLRFDKYLVPASCRSCRDPVCLTECPVGSIGRSPTGAILIEDWCIGCRKCEENCPYGNIEMHLFDVDPSTELFKQQQPVRRARAAFVPPEGMNLSGLPLGLTFDARGACLEYASVPGAAGEEELRAVSGDPAYRLAVDALLRQVETRVPLPVLPADFKPAREIENVVKLKRAGRNEPDHAVIFRGVIDRANIDTYLAASSDPNYRKAVEQAAGQTRGMRAVLSKAVVCDLCESVEQEPNCVYACPHDAAFRVNADEFFKGRGPAD